MAFVYILRSETTHRFYIGSTNDLTRRQDEHTRGHSLATRGRGPWKLVYLERCESLLWKLGTVSWKLSAGNFENDSCAYRKRSWLERADLVGQLWGSSPHEPTISFNCRSNFNLEKTSHLNIP
jgi:hypothetical protein